MAAIMLSGDRTKYQKTMPGLQVDWQRFGHGLRQERERRSLSRLQLEALTGVAATTIDRIERNAYSCNSETFMTLAAAIGKDPRSYTFRRTVSFAQWIEER